ncbi:Alpha/Beta hydrolase protein [Phycomyces nitens]|nr:Alpha/Beta hydrolase protein [Phycomyces nitens]
MLKFTGTHLARTPLCRAYSTVPLAYTHIPGTSTKPPIVICHGLLGSKQTWKSLGNQLAQLTTRSVYALDARNHGLSPHTANHNCKAMAQDVQAFIEHQNLQDPVLLGHSMGGRTAMTFATLFPNLLSKLIVVDVTPMRLCLHDEFVPYFQAMQAITSLKPRTQKETEAILKRYVPESSMRQFLMTNVKRNRDGVYRVQFNTETLERDLYEIEKPLDVSYGGPTLFITGDKSPYYAAFGANSDAIHSMFPMSSVKTIHDAGHWLQSEKPDEFLGLVESFVKA